MKLEDFNEDWCEYRVGDITKDKSIQAIIHQCNCFKTMGAGVAKAIAEAFPEAILADELSTVSPFNRLGSYSKAKVGNTTIYNLYAQYRPGRYPSAYDMIDRYKRLYNGILIIFDNMPHEDIRIGIPYMIGCGISGLYEDHVFEIIRETFLESHLEGLAKVVFIDINNRFNKEVVPER